MARFFKMDARVAGEVIRRMRLSAPAMALAMAALLVAAGCGGAKAPADEKKSAGKVPASKRAGRAKRAGLYRKTLKARITSGRAGLAGRLPIIDLEVMLPAKGDISALIRAMDTAGVALAVVTSGDVETIRRAAARHPGRIVPLTAAPEGKAWATRSAAHLKAARRQLGAGAYGIGRVRMDLGGKRRLGPAPKGGLRGPPLRLSAEKKVPLWLDMAPEDHGLGWLERQLRAHPAASVLWSRAGYHSAPEKLPGYGHGLLRALTLRRPNLFMTLTQRPPVPRGPVPAPRTNLLFDRGGGFSPEWREMIEARIAHFATSSAAGPEGLTGYPGRVRAYRRRILGALTPPARRRLAYRNAWRILTGEDWGVAPPKGG